MLNSLKFDLLPGERIGTSGWKQVSQDRIDRFAEATDDFQFVHLDVARAAAETPFGGTIAHGFLTLSLISALAEEIFPRPAGLKAVMLVALDRVRFVSPLRAGQRVCGDFILDRLVFLAANKALAKVRVTLVIEQEVEPAITCEASWIFLFDEGETGTPAGSTQPAPPSGRA